MKMDFKTVARRTGESGVVLGMDSRRVFDFDGIAQEHDQEEQTFLASLTSEWQEIPAILLDPTTAQNFRGYARRCANA